MHGYFIQNNIFIKIYINDIIVSRYRAERKTTETIRMVVASLTECELSERKPTLGCANSVVLI